jgi:hypothetical protein
MHCEVNRRQGVRAGEVRTPSMPSAALRLMLRERDRGRGMSGVSLQGRTCRGRWRDTVTARPRRPAARNPPSERVKTGKKGMSR